MASITLENITLSYDRHPAVHHINGSFAAGSLTAVVGPNGAGKTTLVKAIAGILKPEKGKIHYHNVTAKHIAYLPQAAEIDRDFPLTVLEFVCMGFWCLLGPFKALNSKNRQKALDAIIYMGLNGLEKRPIRSLSSGQFQRVLFARLIVQDASLLLLDEPFTAMDHDTTEKLISQIKSWHKEGKTIICVLHDLEQITSHFPECLLIARECISWGETGKAVEALQSGPLGALFPAHHQSIICEQN